MTVEYRVNPGVTNAELDRLYEVSWPEIPQFPKPNDGLMGDKR